MAELINLRRARKAKARGDKARQAEASRVKHGVAKTTRDLARAQAERDARSTDAHRLEDKE